MGKNGKIRELVIELLIILAVVTLMTLLSAVPPLSFLYRWAADRQMTYLWFGLLAGVAALCAGLYRSRKK